MQQLMIPATSAAAVFLAFLGYFCIFRPARVQGFAQRAHSSSNRLVQNFPFAKLIFKPWYLTYLRIWGVFAWMMALFFAYLVVHLVLHV